MDPRAMISAALLRAALVLALLMVALLFAAAGLGFAFAAIYLYLLPGLGPGGAAAVVALIGFFIAAMLLLALRLWLRGGRPAPAARPTGQSAHGPTGDDAMAAAREVAAWVGQHPARSMLLALLAGGVLGASPGLRARLERLFDELVRR